MTSFVQSLANTLGKYQFIVDKQVPICSWQYIFYLIFYLYFYILSLKGDLGCISIRWHVPDLLRKAAYSPVASWGHLVFRCSCGVPLKQTVFTTHHTWSSLTPLSSVTALPDWYTCHLSTFCPVALGSDGGVVHAKLPACPGGPLWLPRGCPHLACVPGGAPHSLHVLWTQASSCRGVASILILNLASYSAQSRAHMVGFVSGYKDWRNFG